VKHPPGERIIGVEWIIGHKCLSVGNRGGIVKLNHNESVTIPIGIGAGTNEFAFLFQLSEKFPVGGAQFRSQRGPAVYELVVRVGADHERVLADAP